jgi:hypothetical protein
MANPNAPFGFKPVRRLDGAAWSGNLTTRKVAAANTNVMCKGDIVKQLSTGYIDIATATPSDHSTLGIFYGCHFYNSSVGYNVWSNRFPAGAISAGVDVDAFIIDDPSVVFEVMGSAAAITLASIGLNADFVVATGNALNGISAWTLNSGTLATTPTFPFRVIGLGNFGVNTSPGYDATSANNVVEVCWNDQFLRQMTGI